jgi:predicted alpha/beta superfamily hydrolase
MNRLLLLLVLCIATPPSLFAQDSSKASWATLTIQPATLTDTRTILVATPASYANPQRRYPVLLLLDADDQDQFTAAAANLRFLESRAAIPELILVGIVNGKDRTHDLTPPTIAATAKQFPTAGGESKFVDFLVNDVLPEVRSKYRTMPTTFLAGHSFGGLVALHTASTRREFFGIIAMSPSLWWNDSTAVRGYADSLEHPARPLRLFISSGGLEPAIDVTTQRMVAHLDSVKPKALTYSYRRYVGANHGMTPLYSLIDGVQYLFEPMSVVPLPISTLGPKSDSADVMRAYIASRDAYVAGARSLGFEVNALPEDQVNYLGYGVLQVLKLPRLAVWVFRENVRDYPRSPNVYDSYGDGLLAMGDTASAITQFRRALSVATEVGQTPSSDTKKKLDALERGRAKAP